MWASWRIPGKTVLAHQICARCEKPDVYTDSLFSPSSSSAWYPKHAFRPEDLLTFVELDGFADDWKELKLDDDALLALQILIMSAPVKAPVIKNTGGLRKLRFAPSSWNTGKQGAARVCYVFFQEYSLVLLVAAYAKNAQDDLSAEERRAICQLIERERKALAAD